MHQMSRFRRIQKYVPVVIAVCMFPFTIDISAAAVPFSPDGTLPVLRALVEKKAVPYTIKKKNAEITISSIKDMTMDWQTSRIVLACSFTIRTTGFIPVYKTGDITLSGEALFSSGENSIGVRILGIDRLEMDDIPAAVSKVALSLINSSLKGKEYWIGDAPGISETLTKQNFSVMLKMLISRKLPFTFNTKKSEITLYQLYEFDAYRPGKISAAFYMKGTRKGLIDINYAGVAAVDLALFIDPETLQGYLKIGEISYLKFDDRNAIMQKILSIAARSSLEGKEIKFDLDKRK